MAGTAAAGADPDTPAKEAPSRAPEEQIEAAQRLQRVRANLRLPDRPFAALSADHDAGLRALRLLDFVRLDLSSSGVPRPDLVAELIANYSSSRGRSSVRGEQIEVSLDSFAKALRLPPFGAPAGSDADALARASASREFTKVYIGAPAEASTGMKRRLPHILCVKNKKRGPDYMTELLWELVKQEMEHLIESESTDCVSCYSAFLQRLLWVERPELFQLPPEPSEAVAPAALCVQLPQETSEAVAPAALCVQLPQEPSEAVAPAALCVQLPPEPSEAVAPAALLCVWKEQESNLLSTIHENQECCSESDINRASPKQIDIASKRTSSSAFDSLEGNSAPRKTASVRPRRALSFEGPDVAVQDLPPVLAATPSTGLHKKGRGRPRKVQTDPENGRVTRGSIKSNGFRPTPVVDQQARPKKKLCAEMMVKKQTRGRPQGTMIKRMTRRK